MFVVSANGEECIKIANFDLSRALDPDMSTTEMTGVGELCTLVKQEWPFSRVYVSFCKMLFTL